MVNIEYNRRQPPLVWMMVGIISLFFLLVSFILLFLYPFASTEKKAYFEGNYPILFKGKQVGNAHLEGKSIYVPLSFVTEKLDKTIVFDEKTNSIIITTEQKVVQMPTNSLTYYVNEKPVKLHFPALKAKNEILYIALDSIISFYPVQYKQLEDSNAIWIQQDGEAYKTGTISYKKEKQANLRLRSEPSLQSVYSASIKNKETISIEGEKEDFYFIRKENGIAGYLKKGLVRKGKAQTIQIKHSLEPVKMPKITGPIQLTWEAVYKNNPNLENIPEMAGINVVSPTWFKLANQDGSITNLASLEYSKWAKKRGYQVWALFSNDFNPDLTHLALKDFETRQQIIRQLLHFTKLYELNGINFDIENVHPADGHLVTQLLREATPYLHELGITVSMDVTFISGSGNWSAFYERDQLAKIVDYMIVMAYDEHWGTSPISGSVASLPWVEKNLIKMLEVVPKERLILGVPLYSRLWKEQIQEDQSLKVSSAAMSMEKIKEWIAERKLTPRYDEATGQNYVEHFNVEEQTTYKIWIEDEMSLSKRAELSKKYDLAGVASWSRYFADTSAWAALSLSNNENVTKK